MSTCSETLSHALSNIALIITSDIPVVIHTVTVLQASNYDTMCEGSTLVAWSSSQS